MKLGFVSAILDGWTFEEMIDIAADSDGRGTGKTVASASYAAG